MADYYAEAARILQGVLEHKGGLKSLSYAEDVKHKKAAYALVVETLKYREVLIEIGEKSRFFELNRLKGPTGPSPLVLVMLFDFLIGKGISGGGKLKKTIMQHKNSLQSELTRLKIRRGVTTALDLLPPHIRNPVLLPRYVRVNTLLSTIDEAKSHFQGYSIAAARQGLPAPKSFYEDTIVPSLLVFPPGTDLHADHLFKQGKLILQDRASCLPPVVLAPPANSTVVDACSAPGNKTSLLCAWMGGTGRVIAFDKDKQRFALLKRQLTNANARNAEPVEGSFLSADPMDTRYAAVKYALVDPSCSGSGIVSRLDALIDQTPELDEVTEGVTDRLQQLAAVQRDLVCHAMKFPAMERVVYSTCSIHDAENESVVAAVLAAEPRFRLVNALPEWPHRGKDKDCAGKGFTLRASPETTQTNGFFVALFARCQSGSSTQRVPAEKGGGNESKRKAVEIEPQQVAVIAASGMRSIEESQQTAAKKKKNRKHKKKKTKSEPPAGNAS